MMIVDMKSSKKGHDVVELPVEEIDDPFEEWTKTKKDAFVV